MERSSRPCCLHAAHATFFALIALSGLSAVPLWLSDVMIVAAFLLIPLTLAIAWRWKTVRTSRSPRAATVTPPSAARKRQKLRIESAVAGAICLSGVVGSLVIGSAVGIVFCLAGTIVTAAIHLAN